MTPLQETFARLRANGAGGFIPYITAGDPDLATTYELLLALNRAGASVIELGLPFSDPVADGPVIQRACSRALANGAALRDVLALTKEASRKMDCPLVLFSYVNPVLQYGFENLLRTARENGIAGLLLTDLPGDAAPRLAALCEQHGVDWIALAAPTCSDTRLQAICANAKGFLYAVARTGVTGATKTLSRDARDLVLRIRSLTSLPVAVGFGISSPAQAAEVLAFADAAVVGSAIVQAIETNAGAPSLIQQVERLGRAFAQVGLQNQAHVGR